MSKVKKCSKCKRSFRTSGKGKICPSCKVDNRFFNSSAGRWLIKTIIRGGYWSVLEYTTQDDLIEMLNIHKRCGGYRGWEYNADNKEWKPVNELDIAHLYPVKGNDIGVLHADNLVITPAKLNKSMSNTVFDVGISIKRYDPVGTGDTATANIRSRLKKMYNLKAVVKTCNLKALVTKDPKTSFSTPRTSLMAILIAEATRFNLTLESGRGAIEQFKQLLKGELVPGETSKGTLFNISMQDDNGNELPY